MRWNLASRWGFGEMLRLYESSSHENVNTSLLRARLCTMLNFFLFLGMSVFLLPEAEGRLVHLRSSSFAFQILEPEGWVLDTRAAPQIANFVFHPEGSDWRRSDSNIFVRFIPRRQEGSAKEFWDMNQEGFLEECPFGEEVPCELEGQEDSAFEFRKYICPGVREEIIAVAPVQGYFAMLVLTSKRNHGTADSLEVLNSIAKSFRWYSLESDRK
jgi:hypothetical protein